MAGKGGHTDISQNSSWTKVYVLAPEIEHKSRNEVKKQAWTVNLRSIQYGGKISAPFPERSRRTNCK